MSRNLLNEEIQMPSFPHTSVNLGIKVREITEARFSFLTANLSFGYFSASNHG